VLRFEERDALAAQRASVLEARLAEVQRRQLEREEADRRASASVPSRPSRPSGSFRLVASIAGTVAPPLVLLPPSGV
jgi:hypothetical protein